MLNERRSRKQFHHPLIIADTLQFEVFSSRVISPRWFVPPPGHVRRGLLYHTGLSSLPLIPIHRWARTHSPITDWYQGKHHRGINYHTGQVDTPITNHRWAKSAVPVPDWYQGHVRRGTNYHTGSTAVSPLIQQHRWGHSHSPVADWFVGHVRRGLLYHTGLSDLPRVPVRRWARTHAPVADWYQGHVRRGVHYPVASSVVTVVVAQRSFLLAVDNRSLLLGLEARRFQLTM